MRDTARQRRERLGHGRPLSDRRIARFVIVDGSDRAAGDWTQHAEYCFRRDGSLAFIFCRISTFYSDIGALLVEKRLYFDQTGMRIRETKSLSDLNTGERLKDVEHTEPELPIDRFVKALTAAFPR